MASLPFCNNFQVLGTLMMTTLTPLSATFNFVPKIALLFFNRNYNSLFQSWLKFPMDVSVNEFQCGDHSLCFFEGLRTLHLHEPKNVFPIKC